MKYKYLHIEQWIKNLLDDLSDLESVFNEILLAFAGDVDEATDYMKYLVKSGYLPDDIDIDKFVNYLEKKRLIAKRKTGYHLTRKGEQSLRKKSFYDIFSSLKKGGLGGHKTPREGVAGDILPETRSYQFGDDIASIDYQRSIMNSMMNERWLNLSEQDLEVHLTEHNTSCSTVLLIDISHSMILYGEDRITPAKKVALALAEFVHINFKNDKLFIISFGDKADQLSLSDVPYLDAGPYHTNTKHALELSRQILLKSKSANKQIFMITDGKPSMITENGKPYINPIGLDPKIIAQTLQESDRCRKHGIIITTFMLTKDPYLVEFIDKFTKVNRGRAYFSDSKNIGQFIFKDYIRNRHRRIG